MSIFSLSTSACSSFSLLVIPLEFQNRILRLDILGRENGEE